MTARFQVALSPEPDVPVKGDVLRTLCRQEAAAFSDWLRENEPNFADGLADWEQQAIAVYLYKKVRKLDEDQGPPGSLPAERQDG